MKLKLQERGQSLILIALAAIGLFGFAGLAIDGSRVFSDRRHAQNAADAAALSAALAKIRGDVYTTAAEQRAEDNGYIVNGPRTDVEVHLCNDPLITTDCVGIPTSGDADHLFPGNYIQVKITSILPATFGRIVGRNEFENIVTSIAYAGPVEPHPLANGNALAAMDQHEMDAVRGIGTVNLDVNGSGIFSNSDANNPHCSFRQGGTGTISVDTAVQSVGALCTGGTGSVTGAQQPGVGQMDYPPTINIPIPNFSCGGGSAPAPSYDNAEKILTYHPGNYGRIDPDNDAPPGKLVLEAHFSPGTYCISNGASFNGAPVIANSVRLLITGGDFKINGSVFTCNDMLVHVDGGQGISFAGNGNILCNNVTFVLSTGGVSWNGNVTGESNRMFAPTGGDYDGVLIYMPYPNDKAININGNSSSELTGSIIGVAAPISIEGNSWSTGFHSQVIGNTVHLGGTGNLVINFDPDEQYLQVDPSAIQLTK